MQLLLEPVITPAENTQLYTLCGVIIVRHPTIWDFNDVIAAIVSGQWCGPPREAVSRRMGEI